MWDIESVEYVENECDQPKELEWKDGREKGLTFLEYFSVRYRRSQRDQMVKP